MYFMIGGLSISALMDSSSNLKLMRETTSTHVNTAVDMFTDGKGVVDDNLMCPAYHWITDSDFKYP